LNALDMLLDVVSLCLESDLTRTDVDDRLQYTRLRLRTRTDNRPTDRLTHSQLNVISVERLCIYTWWRIKTGPFHFVAYNVYPTQILQISIAFLQ